MFIAMTTFFKITNAKLIKVSIVTEVFDIFYTTDMAMLLNITLSKEPEFQVFQSNISCKTMQKMLPNPNPEMALLTFYIRFPLRASLTVVV